MFKTTIAAMQITAILLNPFTIKMSSPSIETIAPKAIESEEVKVDKSILNELGYECDECQNTSPGLLLFHQQIHEVKIEKARKAEEARIEALRIAEIARINAEVQAITSENNRKNNVHFDPYDLLNVSNITQHELDQVFIAKGKPAMTEISGALIDAEQTYGVNAFFLASIIAEESGWTEKPAGDGDNLTGYAVYTSTSRGSSFGGSRYQNVMDTADLLKNLYLTPGAKYYSNGLSIWNVNTRYCLFGDQVTTDYGWSDRLTEIAYNFNSIYHSSIKQLKEVPTL